MESSPPTTPVLPEETATPATPVITRTAPAAQKEQIETVTCMLPEINRERTPEKVLAMIGRSQFTNDAAVSTMPSGGTGIEKDVKVTFFRLSHFGHNPSDDEVAAMYEKLGLQSDPYAQAQVNINDTTFADKYPSATHWKNAKSECEWCFMKIDQVPPPSIKPYVWLCHHKFEYARKHTWFCGTKKKRVIS